MSVNGIGQNYYQNYVSATKNTKNVDGADKADSTYELSETEEMEIFKSFVVGLMENIMFGFIIRGYSLF